MKQFLDKIVYGNPTDSQLQLIAEANYLDKLSPKLREYPFPANGTDAIRFELSELVKYQANYKNLPEKQVALIKALDLSYYRYFQRLFVDIYQLDAEEVRTTLESLAADVIPLVYKLKYFYNRPRPYQLAPYFKLRLYPHNESIVNSPSYPSEKTMVGSVFVEVFGSRYPNLYESMTDLQHQLNESRLYLGLNFRSDLEFSSVAAKIVVSTPEFCKKYGI